MSIILKSGASGDLATIDPTSKAIRSSLYDSAGNPIAVVEGYDTPAGQAALLNAGLDDGVAYPLRVGKAGSVGTATGQILFWDDFEGAVVHTGRWVGALTTMTVAQAATGLTINAGASAAANAVAVVNSTRRFERRVNQPIDVSIRARVSAVANSVVELGLGDTTSGTTAIVANGAFFRYAGGTLTPVISYNSNEITGTPVDMTTPTNYGSAYLDYGIAVDDFSVVFVVRHSLSGAVILRQRLNLPVSQAKAFATTRLPVMFRAYNKASAPASAPVFIVGSVSVLRLDDASATPFAHTMSGLGLGGETIPSTGQQAASFANSAAPTSATLSNTAAGYATLGGQFQFAAVAGAETDYALFGYQVPAPFSFFVTRVHISTYNMGAASATTPTVLQWSMATNSTAVSLATATTVPTANAPVRTPVGVQSIPIGTVVGGSVPNVDIPFEAPLFTAAGRFVCVMLKMPVGTATASQIIRGMVTVRGYFV